MEDLEIAQKPKQKEPLAGSGQQGNGHHLSELVSNTRLTPVDSQKKYNIHNRHCMYTYIIYIHICIVCIYIYCKSKYTV